MVEVLPCQTSRFVDGAGKDVRQGGEKVDGNLPKVFGPDGLERCVDPLDIRLAQSELYVFELCGLGEVN